MNSILICGNSRKIFFLAKSLLHKGHRVTIVCNRPDMCQSLSRSLEKAVVVCGDGTEPKVLADADAVNHDILIGMALVDYQNLVTCLLAKDRFSVKRTVAVVNNPNNVDIYKRLGVDSVVCTTHVIAMTIEQRAVEQEISDLLSLEEGKVEILEIKMKEQFPLSGKHIREITFPGDATIGCIIRDGKPIIPNGETVVSTGDQLIVLALPEAEDQVYKAITGARV